MRYVTDILGGKRKYLLVLLLLPVAVICLAFGITDTGEYDKARREVLLRRIGHELLLHAGDSTSRTLPVEKIDDDEYQVRFEHEFAFKPESLVKITRRLLAKDAFTQDYVVNVLNCSNASVAYGYAIAGNRKDDIVTCKGRIQPKACYIVNVKFKPKGVDLATTGYILGGLPFLAFVGFMLFKAVKPQPVVNDSRATNKFSLGTVLFDAGQRQLMLENQTIDLTGTETRLLRIFALSPNQTIARSRLQKEIWEDEGVIVGRSLDMFISKLRKKLEMSSTINIVVVRGKGYRLEVGD
ncbi:transcriptional regulator [Mucilaginibacter hurinus]|uniref:Transcriptional regulator n=1 Tax=Mucilaginibacter hurinus TaxID=2201324 RepID=A0A367GRY1_9SPHI|nr:winged helix-turn-helix domain-containing protein [Mucilaginibacter hurinus]RCH56199.1 transcriptional regulator [Mucilaginibacter hurinus]